METRLGTSDPPVCAPVPGLLHPSTPSPQKLLLLEQHVPNIFLHATSIWLGKIENSRYQIITNHSAKQNQISQISGCHAFNYPHPTNQTKS